MKARKLWRSSQLIAGLVSIGALAACASTGDSHDNNPAASAGVPGASAGTGNGQVVGTGGGSPTGTGGVPGGGGMIVIDDPTKVVPESAGIMVMRRLNYREYDHMLALLLGDTTAPASGANSWSPDMTDNTGFVAPSSVAAYHVTQYMQTADALVDKALTDLAAGKKTGKFTIPCTNPTAAQEAACVTTFITTFGKQAYRRPVAAEEQADLVTLFNTAHTTNKMTFTESIGAVTKAMLQSPNFLYHWEIGPTKPAAGSDGLKPLTSWQVASRLATSLWESMPDDTLLTAAQGNMLSTPDQVVAQAQRMLADPQANQALYNFHLQWFFNMGFHVTDLAAIDAKLNTALTVDAAAGLQNEFTQFLASVYAPTGDGTLNTLYTAPYAFVNKDLAAIYGVAPPATGFAKVALDPTQRAGIFTQVAFLAGIQDSVADNPVYRGLAIYTKALCGHTEGPPANVPGVNFVDSGTTRQAYSLHASSPCTMGCHDVFDPPGFAFENYDGVGKYRTTDNGQTVDSTGTFSAPASGSASPTKYTFNNALEMVKQLAASPEAQSCIDRQWARYSLGRMESAADQGSLQAAFKKGAATAGFSIRDMLVTLLSSKAFMFRQPSEGEPL